MLGQGEHVEWVSLAVKMEINSKPAANSCDFSQCLSSGTTVAQETGNLKLRTRRSAIGIGSGTGTREREREQEKLSLILFPLCASFVSLILNCEFCFDSSYAASASLLFLKFRASAVETGSAGTQDRTVRATSSHLRISRCRDRLFPSVGPEVFMSFVTNR